MTKPIPNWPFPVPGQIKKPPTTNELCKLEAKAARNEQKRALEETLQQCEPAPF
jgi:hypothetical protein